MKLILVISILLASALAQAAVFNCQAQKETLRGAVTIGEFSFNSDQGKWVGHKTPEGDSLSCTGFQWGSGPKYIICLVGNVDISTFRSGSTPAATLKNISMSTNNALSLSLTSASTGELLLSLMQKGKDNLNLHCKK